MSQIQIMKIQPFLPVLLLPFPFPPSLSSLPCSYFFFLSPFLISLTPHSILPLPLIFSFSFLFPSSFICKFTKITPSRAEKRRYCALWRREMWKVLVSLLVFSRGQQNLVPWFSNDLRIIARVG